MLTLSPCNLCEAEVIEADGESREYTLSSLSSFEWAYLMVDFAPDPGVTLTLEMDISSDGTNWYNAYIHNLRAAAAVDLQAASIVLSAATGTPGHVVLALKVPAPYLRLVATPNEPSSSSSSSSSGVCAGCTLTARLMLVG